MIHPKTVLSLEELAQYHLYVPPRAGGYWKGIRHWDLVNLFLDQLRARQWFFGRLRLAVSKDETNMAGSCDVFPFGLPEIAGADFSLGILNSNSQEFALRLMAGLRVKSSDTGVVLAEFQLGRSTIGNDMKESIDKALGEAYLEARLFRPKVDQLQVERLSERQVVDLLIRVGRKGLLPWSRVGAADVLFRVAAEKTAWNLLVSFAEAAKMNPPIQQMDQLLKIYQMISE